ncbi:MAG: hypothetical protein R3E79_03560 [Caldilineaceae bacterium]
MGFIYKENLYGSATCSTPLTQQPYLLRDREGERYLIGTQLVTVIASPRAAAAFLNWYPSPAAGVTASCPSPCPLP